ncbi:hypothetical protein [Paraflavitalea speifideaquila]|uniref:hypothetical protein n=1 Tax=Paraflavitalea speifideaquila TaxID=3076558 RepID=UPI0028E5676A|nr:hypothetical protein [Paraflavitalea speifideiaquila]
MAVPTCKKGPGYYAGDLSGITAKKYHSGSLPFINLEKDSTHQRLEPEAGSHSRRSPNWDIGFVVGVPA